MYHQGENTLKTSLGPASPQEGPRGLGFCRERPARRWPRSGRPEQPSLVAQAPGTHSSGFWSQVMGLGWAPGESSLGLLWGHHLAVPSQVGVGGETDRQRRRVGRTPVSAHKGTNPTSPKDPLLTASHGDSQNFNTSIWGQDPAPVTKSKNSCNQQQ